MNLTISIKKESAWEFDTFGSGGASISVVAINGGTVRLRDPQNNLHSFYYGGAGAGLSAGFKFPKIGKIEIKTPKGGLTGSVGPTSFRSGGKLYVLSGHSRNELSRSDIRGVCVFIEIGAGIIAGWSGVAMLLDLNPMWLVGMPATTPFFINSAKGLLLMHGGNVGIQAGGGITILGGALL